MDNSVKMGDWVRSYNKGIWRVYRIEEIEELDPVSGQLRSRSSIFSSRFVNDSFKRSFSSENCHPTFVSKLCNEELERLNVFISEKTKQRHPLIK